MIAYLIFGLFLFALFLFILYKISNISHKIFRFIPIIILFIFLSSIFLLFLRINPTLISTIPAIAFFLYRWRPVILFLKNLVLNKKKNYSSNFKNNRNFTNQMTEDEAYEILGLNKGASKKEILTNYHKLLKKNHPDVGGSSWISSKINKAKETLLG